MCIILIHFAVRAGWRRAQLYDLRRHSAESGELVEAEDECAMARSCPG
jgi:hypothetical protein